MKSPILKILMLEISLRLEKGKVIMYQKKMIYSLNIRLLNNSSEIDSKVNHANGFQSNKTDLY